MNEPNRADCEFILRGDYNDCAHAGGGRGAPLSDWCKPCLVEALGRLTADRPDFVLRLLWTCEECGWTCAMDAPGFAGDGHWHYPDGQTPCGPITAQKARGGTPQTAQRSLRDPDADAADTAAQTLDGTLPYTETWHTNATNVVGLVGRVGRLEEALRGLERELRFRAARIDDVPYTAASLVFLADEIAAALVGVETGEGGG